MTICLSISLSSGNWQVTNWTVQPLNKNLPPAFLRNHRINGEGGIIPEEYRVEYVADRTQTISTAFLGLTLECARCHDHKYDPVSQQEYYELSAFFNQINEEGQGLPDGNSGPAIELNSREAQKHIAYLQTKIRQTEQKLQQHIDTIKLPKSKSPVPDLSKDRIVHLTMDRGIQRKANGRSLKDDARPKSYAVRGQPEIIRDDRGNGTQMYCLRSGPGFSGRY